MRDWGSLLVSFGWAELGQSVSGEGCFRLLLQPFVGGNHEEDEYLEEEPLLLQPDGELWAGAWTGYRRLWVLELVAERGELGELTAYRLTEKSLRRASQLGLTREGFCSWLSEAAGNGMPHSVEALLGHWMGELPQCSRTGLFPAERIVSGA